MATPLENEDLPSTPPKKRKLKHPRTSKACGFCRKRKVRCTGTYPCDYCQEEGVRCEYDDELIRPAARESPAVLNTPGKLAHHAPILGDAVSSYQSHRTTPQEPGPPSTEPPQAFAEGQHIGPTSGVSLLYHLWNRIDEAPIASASISSHGDFPQQPVSSDGCVRDLPEANALLERYFRFATPTYRYLHRPSLEKWAAQLVADEKSLPVPKAACVLLACAQSLLFTIKGNRYDDKNDKDMYKSRQLFEKAKDMLDHEPGPATLSSVQARLAMCLYLLSTFRITECRFCFSFASTILTSLGLHRKTSTTHRLELIEIESRRRVFWCAYVLDGYLSVMLGRPRLFRDEDIDQPYPRNFDDQDLTSAESADELPMHGNLEAFVAHANLAKLMGRSCDRLYPLAPLEEDQIIDRTTEMILALESWKSSLPEFLRPRTKTMTGQRTFERQNTVLKLAHAHLCILSTRRCLLIDFTRSRRSSQSIAIDDRGEKAVQECIKSITTIVTTTSHMMDKGGIYQAFWFTQYILLVAISTLYVLLIQFGQSQLPVKDPRPHEELHPLFVKAKKCQQHLADNAPEGSQAKRHHKLLDHLRAKCEKEMARGKYGDARAIGTLGEANVPNRKSRRTSYLLERGTGTGERLYFSDANSALNPQLDTATQMPTTTNALASQPLISSAEDCPSSNIEFTPSDEDTVFQNMLGWDWESLDTLGFPPVNELYFDTSMV